MSYSKKKRSFEDYQESQETQDSKDIPERTSKIKKLFDRNDSITQELLKELSKDSENSDINSYISIDSPDTNNKKDDKNNEKLTDISSLDDEYSVTDFDIDEKFSSLEDSEIQDIASLSLSSLIIDVSSDDTTTENEESSSKNTITSIEIKNDKDDDYYHSDVSSIVSSIDKSDLFSDKSYNQTEAYTFTYLKKQVEDTRLDEEMKSLINNSKKYIHKFKKEDNDQKDYKQPDFVTDYIENISYNDDESYLDIDLGLSEKYVVDSDEEELQDNYKEKIMTNGEMEIDTGNQVSDRDTENKDSDQNTEDQGTDKLELDTNYIIKQIRDLDIKK